MNATRDRVNSAMKNHEAALWAYLRLAFVSHQKRQYIGRDKFLVLAGIAACNSGWPEIAEQCRLRVLENNPAHIIGKSDSFIAAMRDEEFQSFAKQFDRFCTFEKAEHLLYEQGIAVYDAATGSLGPTLVKLLQEMRQNQGD